MTILDYYLEKQKDVNWYNCYQSVADKNKGKLFSFIDTNFRKLDSFFTQLEAFVPKDGKKRSDWDTMDCGQEADKHRVVKLKNAGFINLDSGSYYITPKGKEALRIFYDKNLSDREKWILLLMLLSNYKTDKRNFDLIRTVVGLSETLSIYGISRIDLMTLLKNSCNITDKTALFKTDIFWLMTFFTDADFIKLYLASSKEEKNKLQEYVIKCSENKESKDCIAHKFVSSGVYQVNTFHNDINICLCVLVVIALQDKNWDAFLKLISDFYYTVRLDKMLTFISTNKDLYDSIYKDSYLTIFKEIK